ncbi:MAG: type II toxin-antitoxin system toxin ribonuclease VapC11 [Turneriella sp.]
MYLIDTSAWIAFFRQPGAKDWFRPEEIAICLPIYEEVLQGIRHDAAYREIKPVLEAAAFFDDPLPRERYEKAIHIFRAGRKLGKAIRSATDCLIAAIAIKYDLVVLHDDRDFSIIAGFTDLRERRVG